MGTSAIWATMPLRSDVLSETIHLVVPMATLLRMFGFIAFIIARIAVIWVPPAIIIGTFSAAPRTSPANAGIMGSPTQFTAPIGSFFRDPCFMPSEFRPASTVLILRSCGLLGMLLLTFPLAL